MTDPSALPNPDATGPLSFSMLSEAQERRNRAARTLHNEIRGRFDERPGHYIAHHHADDLADAVLTAAGVETLAAERDEARRVALLCRSLLCEFLVGLGDLFEEEWAWLPDWFKDGTG